MKDINPWTKNLEISSYKIIVKFLMNKTSIEDFEDNSLKFEKNWGIYWGTGI